MNGGYVIFEINTRDKCDFHQEHTPRLREDTLKAAGLMSRGGGSGTFVGYDFN